MVICNEPSNATCIIALTIADIISQINTQQHYGMVWVHGAFHFYVVEVKAPCTHTIVL